VKPAAVLLAGVLAVLPAACGDGGPDAPESKAAWMEEHEATVNGLGIAVDRVQAATKEGEPTRIRAECEGLRDTTIEARELPPVPDAAAETAWRDAVDAIATAAGNCTRATAMSDVRLLERSIGELREARVKLDTANARLNA
jgi:hypothetical protein